MILTQYGNLAWYVYRSVRHDGWAPRLALCVTRALLHRAQASLDAEREWSMPRPSAPGHLERD